MKKGGYKGISYPMRISNQGGVVTSSTSKTDVPHIEESIRQIFATSSFDRVMEPEVYSQLQEFLFEPNDLSLQQLMKYKIVEDLNRLEERIMCSEDGIEFSTDEDNVLWVSITYVVLKYETTFTSLVKVGEVNE